MTDALPQIIYRVATDPNFLAKFQANPEAAAASYGLSLSDEERLALMEVQSLFSRQPVSELSNQQIGEPYLLAWIGSKETFTPAAFADDYDARYTPSRDRAT